MLDFNKLHNPVSNVVPILNQQFVYHRKKYFCNVEDGWYNVTLQGNEVKKSEPVYPGSQFLRLVKGYTYNNNFIPLNFDSFKRNFGYEVMTNLNFNNLPTMSAVTGAMWEDNKLYLFQQDFSNMIIFEIQDCIDEEGNIHIEDKKGLTPEIKTLLLFHSIERKNQIKLKKQLEETKKIEEYKKSMPGRLMLSFQEVGAEVLKYSIQGKNLIVDWALEGGQEFNSVIDSETFRIVQAGYCMSGDDKRHNIKSMVLTAKNYEEEDLIHITRRN